jgi:signal transduction histidine kinase
MTEPTGALRRFDESIAPVYRWLDRWLPLRRMRPLDRVPSLKLKLTIVLGAAVIVAATTVTVGGAFGLHPMWAMATAVAFSVVSVQILARGITAPLREMTEATSAVASGDYGLAVSATSVDEVGRLAQAFNEMSANLADLERQRNDLISNVSHELRTPLAVLHAGLENLLDGVVEDDHQTLQAMLNQTQRLARLVGELLTLSRLEAGATAFHPTPIDIVGVVEEVVAEACLRHPPPTITVNAPSKAPIVGDPQQLHSVIANLIDNAIRHGGEGAVVVTVNVTDDAATIEVSDDGPGVPPADLERIFERFYRSDSARPGGSGLGLAIASWIVDLHGGAIGARNIEPHGCAITVTIPLGLL